jgi:transcriptional regulator with XRE-family HTH domain
MDWIRLGLVYRALRIRRGWRQADLAARASVSRSLVSKIERGLAGQVPAATLVRVAAALDARLDIGLRWHAEGLDRLLDSAHALMVERVVELLTATGWDVAVEVSFAINGERGSIDVFARHRSTGDLLVVEVKSVVPDHQAMMRALDRNVRLAPRIAADRGWEPVGPISRLLVVAEGTTSRRRIAALAATYATTLPDRGTIVRQWLREPVGSMAGLLFLPYAAGTSTRPTTTGVSRVRGPDRAVRTPDSSPNAGRDGTWGQRPAEGRRGPG